MKKRDLFLFSLCHFLVDFSCGFLLYRCLPGRLYWGEFLLLYNFLAFGMQMPLGLLLDRYHKNGSWAACGVFLTAAAFPFVKHPLLCVLLLGLGNALFHAGGGLFVHNGAKGRVTPLGIFVAPGALGIFWGPMLGKGDFLPLWAMGLPLLLLGLLLCKKQNQNEAFRPEILEQPGLFGPLLALFFVVVLRSFLGGNLRFPYKGEQAFLLCLSTVLGKAAGGVLSDCFGLKRACLWPLLLSSLCLFLSKMPVFGLLGVFLFNMSMPLSLYLVGRRLSGLWGFGFGLLTFGLFLGFLPGYWGFALPFSPPLYGALALVSLPLLLYGEAKP